MNFPPYLKPGDLIGIVSTASVIDKSVVEPAIELLKSKGYRLKIGKHIYARWNQFAGTDKQRAADLQTMIDNPEIKAIFCSRGGYGTLRTIETIRWDQFQQSPKWIVGFSDITVLHARINQLGISTIHGAMPRYFSEAGIQTQSFSTLIDTLQGKPIQYSVKPSEFNRPGTAKGQLIGGNLSIIYSLRGTPHDFDPDNKILFIEDLSEYLYHIDRIMLNLKTGGKLASLAGIVVGGFTGLKDNETPFGMTIEEIINSAVADYTYPVAFNFPAGHQPQNFAMKLGAVAQLEITNESVIFQQN